MVGINSFGLSPEDFPGSGEKRDKNGTWGRLRGRGLVGFGVEEDGGVLAKKSHYLMR